MKENSIEEAIDRLEYVNRAYDCNNYYSRYDLDCIEILLSDYKRVLKENEELKEFKKENKLFKHRLEVANDFIESRQENLIPENYDDLKYIINECDLESTW